MADKVQQPAVTRIEPTAGMRPGCLEDRWQRHRELDATQTLAGQIASGAVTE